MTSDVVTPPCSARAAICSLRSGSRRTDSTVERPPCPSAAAGARTGGRPPRRGVSPVCRATIPPREVRNSSVDRRCSGDVEVPAEGFADDLAGRGVVGAGACFDGGTEFGVEAHGDDLGGSRSHGRATAARSERARAFARVRLRRPGQRPPARERSRAARRLRRCRACSPIDGTLHTTIVLQNPAGGADGTCRSTSCSSAECAAHRGAARVVKSDAEPPDRVATSTTAPLSFRALTRALTVVSVVTG